MTFIYSLLQDFTYYYTATKLFLTGHNPYITFPPNSFIYPPSSLLFLSPLSFIPLEIARPIWTGISLLSLYLSFHFLIKSKISRIIAFVICILFFFPTKFTLGMGQINHFVLLGYVLTYHLCIQKKDLLSGLILGITASLKFVPILFIFYFLFYRRFQIVFVAVVSFLLLNLLPIIFYPPLLHTYISIFNSYSNIAFSYYNQSLSGALYPYSLLRFLSSIFILFFTLKKLLKLPLSLHSFSLFLTTMILLSPVSWQHHLVWLIPPIIFGLSKLSFATIIGLVLISINLSNPHILPYPLYYHATLGTLLLYLFLVRKHN